MISISGMINMLMNFLGTPLGARVKSMKQESDNGWDSSNIKKMGLIATILKITRDDVCIGAEPFYYKTQCDLTSVEKLKFDKILKQLNRISKWVAYDLLADGYSVYKPKLIGNSVYFMPIIKKVKFVLSPTQDVLVYDQDDNRIKDVLVFINYDKTSLSERTDENGEVIEDEFNIKPKSIQLDDIEQDAYNLAAAEASVNRYRRQLSKVLRFVTVEVGVNQGNSNQDFIDDISSGINADSESLEGTTSSVFDDQIPVFPVRRGLGKPEINESIPSANISDLKDIDNLMSKIFLGTRFPKTYADFSQSLDSNVVSLIRGDIRYSRMVTSCRTLIETSVNNYLSTLSFVKRTKLVVALQTVPSPEDSDTIDSMRGYQDFLNEAITYIFEGDSYEEALYRLDSFVLLLGNAASMKSIESWIQRTKDRIKEKYSNGSTDEGESEDGNDLLDEPGVEDESSLENFMEDENTESDEIESDETESEETEESSEYSPNEVPSFPSES